jgi:hypothetical protein
MPSASTWGYFIYVNLAFILLIALVFYYSSVAEIKQNWAQYRCNPMYMPLSDNIEQDFQYCIQNTQMNFMGYILQPLTFLTSNLNANAASSMTEINNIRGMFDKVRTFLSTIVQSIFGVFFNLIIEFQKVTISIKDLMGKTIGILTTVLYMMDGSVKTMNSTWNGPPGQLVKSLGKCFHPKTLIHLKNNMIVPIDAIKLDDILLTGEKVIGILRFSNKEDDANYEELYELDCVSGEKIYITGSHYVYDDKQNKFVEIKKFSQAHKYPQIKTDLLYCLITDTHKIHIGGFTFWDYDDFELRLKDRKKN